jgi:Family of unknown function (DUF6491)
MKKTLLAVLGAVMLASTPASAQRSCLMIGQIYNWNAPDNKTLIVEDNSHQKFKLSLMGSCNNLTFKERVGFQSPGSTQLSCLSKGDDVLVRNPGFPQTCPIIDIVPYTAQMEQADKAAAAAAKAQSDSGH